MGVLLVGECLGSGTRRAGKPGNEWDETYVVVLDGMKVEQVTVASVEKFRGTLPEPGQVVALECAVRVYPKKTGGVGYSFTAFGRSERVESSLPVSARV